MANVRLSMRKIKEALRLSAQCGLSRRQVAHSLKISRATVANYLKRAQKAGISWPGGVRISPTRSSSKGFSHLRKFCRHRPAPLPDFDYIYRELKTHKKLNLTLDCLWREYKEQYPDGYQYSQFCDLYRRFRNKLDYSMRQDHRGGEKLFVDYTEGLKLLDSAGKPPSFLCSAEAHCEISLRTRRSRERGEDAESKVGISTRDRSTLAPCSKPPR